MMAQAEALVLEGVSLFPVSPLMRIFAGHFVRAMSGNVFLERVNLRLASTMMDSTVLDLRFFCFARMRQLRDEESAGAVGSMLVETRLYFDAMQEDAANRVSVCRSLILSFFANLCERTPDLVSLERKGDAIFKAMRETEAIFKELLQIVPSSVPVMRAYAEFLLDVANHPKLAESLANDADQTEDKVSKARSVPHDARDLVFGSVGLMDLGSDGIGLLRVSARDSSASGGALGAGQFGPSGASAGLGVVTACNAGALKLLGYAGSRRELIGREMSLLLPPPIAQVHPRYLSAFLQNGRQRLTGSNRVLFVSHREGHLVPVKAHVQATGDQWLVAMEEISAPQLSILWLRDAASGWRITAADRRAATTFGLSQVGLRSGSSSASLSGFMSDTAATMRSIKASPGRVVLLANLTQGLASSRSFVAVQGALREDLNLSAGGTLRSTSKDLTSAYFTAHAQEISAPLVEGSIWILILAVATSAEVNAAAQAGVLSMAGVAPQRGAGASGSGGAGGGKHHGLDDEEGGDDGSDVDGSSLVEERSDDGSVARMRTARAVNAAAAASDEGAAALPALAAASAARARPPRKGVAFMGGGDDGAATTAAVDVGANADGASEADGERHHNTASAEPKTAKFGPGGSLVSAGTAGSGDSHLSPVELIRRGVKARSGRLESSLEMLRKSLLLVTFVVLATNVATYLVSNELTTKLLANLNSLAMTSSRANYAQRLIGRVQKFVAHADVSLGFPRYDLGDGEDAIREKIRSLMVNVETLHRQLYLEAEQSGIAEWYNEYHDPRWTVKDLVPGTYVDRDTFVATQRNVSFSDLIIEYTTRCHVIWWCEWSGRGRPRLWWWLCVYASPPAPAASHISALLPSTSRRQREQLCRE